jgi:hypothetical protein
MGEVTMKASALQTFVAVIDGAYVLGEEGQPLDVTEAQAKTLLADGLIVLGVDEAPIQVDPPASLNQVTLQPLQMDKLRLSHI